jgi:predicted transglutaminase-like cysteine proteinase
MITVSFAPYAARKAFCLTSAILLLCSLCSFARPVFLNVDRTPYDHQMSRIRPVLLSHHKATSSQDVTLAIVNSWIWHLRAIPYGFSPQWMTPSEVKSASMADCKGKAVALYDIMRSHGARNVRLVIGKRSWMSRKTHAWLEWTTPNGTYVLDPTINWTAARVSRFGSSFYIPFYAYAGNQKYRAADSALYAKGKSRARHHRSLLAVNSAPAAH